MAQGIRCSAPGCRSFGNTSGGLDVYAVDPALCGYTEVPLCSGCSCDAVRYGVRTVRLLEARAMIMRHEVVVAREDFFMQFALKGEGEQEEAIAA